MWRGVCVGKVCVCKFVFMYFVLVERMRVCVRAIMAPLDMERGCQVEQWFHVARGVCW